MVTGGSHGAAAKRNEAIVAALSKHLSELSLDPKSLPRKSVEEDDILSLFTSILLLSGNDASLKNKDEVMKWVKFAHDFPSENEACLSSLKGLNEELANKSVLLVDGLKTSEADIVVFSALHSVVSHLSKSDLQNFPNVMRWMDYVQNVEDFGVAFEKILVEKATLLHPFKFQGLKNGDKLDINQNQNSKKVAQTSQDVEKKSDSDPMKAVEKKTPVDSKPSEEKKKKVSGKETADKEKDAEISVTVLNIQVGLIRKAWKHPSADSLLVEEIDLGDGNLRQVVSGLAKYCSPDYLTNRRVVLITNVKPGKLRDVMSSGLVLCASSQDHTVVEPLLPPEGAVPGERISFSRYEGKPEDVLNPKKKQLDKITPDLYTDDKGVATYKGIPFMTSAGPCTSSIPKASIK